MEPQAANDLIGEFIAIRHLLFSTKVFDRFPVSGEGHSFSLSSEKSYQIVTGARKTKNIVPYARFLWTDMAGAKIDIAVDDGWIQSAIDGPVLDVYFDHYNHTGKITYVMPDFGKVQISPHAVERYTERNTDFIKAPRRSLMRFLNKEGFTKTKMPDSVLKHKRMRYGPNDPVEVWTYPESGLYLLFVLKDGYKELVTIYMPDLTLVKERQAMHRRKTHRANWLAAKEASKQASKKKRQIRIVL
tara:strand:+ start:1952 stop:2683 length:732 start_codon:yes stop_codon:yes gene_type:complete